MTSNSTKLLKAIEYMTIITCIEISQAMVREFDKMDLNFNNLKVPKGDNFLEDEEDEKNYEELHRLYTTNYLIIKEFALYIVEHVIFF